MKRKTTFKLLFLAVLKREEVEFVCAPQSACLLFHCLTKPQDLVMDLACAPCKPLLKKC